jgi:glucose-1-phosphate adenylyltransferase
MSDDRVLAIVLAGGEGTRLAPLTAERSKPAVPFGARYRIVDFVLSNLINSGIYSVYLLVQYKSQSLIEHVRNAWVLSPILRDHFVTVVPPQMREGPDWFQGTADAVYQNLSLVTDDPPGTVAIFGADHIYRMDVCQMLAFHREREADVTVAALPVPVAEASGFGVIGTEADGRITSFVEKPSKPPTMPGDPTRAFASMGNYLFRTEVLVDALRAARRRGERDFGRDVLPHLVGTKRLFAYDFAKNEIPGVHATEERGYWRDVGTLDAYFAANMDMLGEEPRFNLFNPRWPIKSSSHPAPAANFVRAQIECSQVGTGSLVKAARIRNSVVRREVVIEDDVELDECIIMDYCVIRRGARLRRVIVDRYNEIAAGERIGYDAEADRKRFTVSPGGVVVLPLAPARSAASVFQ